MAAQNQYQQAKSFLKIVLEHFFTSPIFALPNNKRVKDWVIV